MSHKIALKNCQRDVLKAQFSDLLVILENPDVDYTFTPAQDAIPGLLAERTRQIASQCPMCSRIFYVGDTLCNCSPVVEEKPGPDGEKVKVMRVVGLYNRHSLRKMVCKGARRQKRDNLILKQHAVFEAVKNAQRMSRAEWTRQSMAASRARRIKEQDANIQHAAEARFRRNARTWEGGES